MTFSLRVFFVGGLISYRALFNWLNPWVYVPILVIGPVAQLLFFAFLGRTAELESDSFYVVGNALQIAALPGLFALSQAIDGERWAQTLPSVLATPAARAPLFLGRGLPVIANGFAVSAFTFACGAALLHFRPPLASLPPLALVTVIAAFSCCGLGFTNAAIGLRVREVSVLSNVVNAVLIIFTGANIRTESLPRWMEVTAHGLPLTHAIEAARRVVAGDTLSDVAGLLAAELAIGGSFMVAGFVLLRFFEAQGRKHATLERA